jgi:ribulose kinase
MAIVAGVDFGMPSVRVSLVDSERRLLESAVHEYPLHRKREHLYPLHSRLYFTLRQQGRDGMGNILPALLVVAAQLARQRIRTLSEEQQ